MSFFRFGARKDFGAQAAAEQAVIKKCLKVLGLRKPHPMAVYFARIRLSAAQQRLSDIDAAKAQEAESEMARAGLMPGRSMAAGSRYDPAASAPRDEKPRPLGHSAPSLPASACWRPPACQTLETGQASAHKSK